MSGKIDARAQEHFNIPKFVSKGNDNSDEEEMEGLSAYERSILERKKCDLEYFRSLGLEDIKKEAIRVYEDFTPKRKKVKRPDKMKTASKIPVRRSSRLQNKPPPHPDSIPLIVGEPEPYELPPQLLGPLVFQDVSLQEDDTLTATLLSDFQLHHNEKLENAGRSFSWYKDNFSSMKLKSRVAKLVPHRITSLSWHPSSKLLVAGGDKKGRIGLWDVESENQNLYLYRPHSFGVTCLEFNPTHNSKLYSSSYDGAFRCGDLECGVFQEVYRSKDDESLTSFDFLSPSSFLISHRSGEVVLFDERSKRSQGEIIVNTNHRKVKTLSIHPGKMHFITCGNEGTVNLWDVRASVKQKKPITQIHHSRSVNSAFFSPLSGNQVLTTSMDHTLCVYDSSSMKGPMNLKTSIKHNNHTGRWLTPFRAVWLPNVDECFVVGSMEYPRRIEVYSTSGRLVYNFSGEDLGSVCCINTFHPSRAALAGGNSSGKIFIFVGKD